MSEEGTVFKRGLIPRPWLKEAGGMVGRVAVAYEAAKFAAVSHPALHSRCSGVGIFPFRCLDLSRYNLFCLFLKQRYSCIVSIIYF